MHFQNLALPSVLQIRQLKTVAKVLVEKWLHVYSVLSGIHSDQGHCFDSNVVKALCKMYGVEQSFTSPYNP